MTSVSCGSEQNFFFRSEILWQIKMLFHVKTQENVWIYHAHKYILHENDCVKGS